MIDQKKSDRIIKFFSALKHTKGEFYGRSFSPLPWEEKILRDVYGTVNPIGLRQYQTIYLEVPKKNGKSTLVAGTGLYHTFADGERNGEVYGCAAEREQASIVFDTAVEMIDQIPALKKRTRLNLSKKLLTDIQTGTFYQVLSAESYCLSPFTIIDLADGNQKLAADIIKGDSIIGWNGNRLKAGKVVSVEKQMPSPIYRITTCRGRELSVTGEHPVLTMTPGRRPQDQTHIYEWKKAGDLQRGDRIRIALGWPTHLKSGDTEEAWALGAWAGDGECGRFRFTNIDLEIVERLRFFIEKIGSTLVSKHSTRQHQGNKLAQYPIEHAIMGIGKRRKSAGREWIRIHFGQSARSHTKTLPEIIWRGGPSVWAAFLAGYLDTDGCVPTLSPQVKWSSRSQKLLESCQVLLARLGINGSLTAGNLQVSGRVQLSKIQELISPFMSNVHKKGKLAWWVDQPYSLKFNAHETDRIVSVEMEPDAPTISIEVEGIHTHVTNGIITHNSKHGLNPSAVIFDELHAQPNRDLYDVMTFGAGSARRQPIWWLITTAGDDPDRVSICWEVHEMALQFLEARRQGDAEKDDPSWYPVIFGYDGDDVFNEANWKKANPSLGVTIQLDTVRAEAKKAKMSAANKRLFLWLRLNQWTTTKLTTWLPIDLFDKTVGKWRRNELLGKKCYLGQDLSSSTDLSAICLIFPPQEGLEEWRVVWDCWIPANGMEDRIRNDHIPYDKWVREFWLQVTPGDVVDYNLIKERILEIKKLYQLIELDSDRTFAAMLLQQCETEGITCVDVPQTFAQLTDPMKTVEVLLKTGKMTHEDNPVARWCFGNTSIATNGNAQIKYVKEHKGKSVDRTKRIDLMAALVIGMARARFYVPAIDVSAAILSDDFGF